jgi:CTD kinase subunit gamma
MAMLNDDGIPDNLGDMPPSRTLPPYNTGSGSSSRRGGNAPQKLDKKQIEQRIEEDRERHKRQREHTWAVPAGEDAELERLWEETSDLNEDDHRMGEEEWAEWKAEFEARRCEHQRENANGPH